jgi:AAA domain
MTAAIESPRPRFAALPGSYQDGELLLARCPACQRGTASLDLVDWIECSARCAHDAIVAALFAPPQDGPADVSTEPLRVRGVDLGRVRPFRWAWRGRLLLGYLNLLVGDEGVGKGTFLAWLVARLTRGELPGDLVGKAARVLIVGDEDGFDNVTVPRLIAAGADVEHVLDLPTADGGALDITREADKLADLLRRAEIDVVVFDQLLDNLGDTDAWKGREVRAALAPARRVAAELDVALVATLHTNKSSATTFRQRVADSAAFNALSRSSLLLAEHPDDEHRRLLIRGKGNYAAPPPALAFSLTSGPLEIGGHVHEPTRIVDLAECDITLAEVLGKPASGTVSKAQQARDLIAEALDDGRWHDAAPLRAQLAETGISDSGIRRAANDLGVERRRTGGFPSRNEWRLARGVSPTGPTAPTAPTAASGRRSSGFSGRSGTRPAREAGEVIPLPLPRGARSAIGADCDDDGEGA